MRVREEFGAIPLATGIAQAYCQVNASSTQQAACNSINLNQFSLIDSVVSAFQNNSGLAMLIGNILNLLFNLVAIVVSFKITWKLLKKFVMMIFLPITSPFIFATVAIPGRGTQMLFDYLKQMANCALHFIVTYCLFLVIIVFANPAFQSTIPGASGANGYRPPVLAGWLPAIPNLTANSSLIFTILALGLFLYIPAILDQIDERFKSAPFPLLQGAVKELRSSSDIAFRQAPAVIGTVGRNILSGAGRGLSAGTRLRDSFRAPGEASSQDIAQQRGAAALASAEARLADAKAAGNNVGIIAAQAALARAKAANAILPGRAAPKGDEAQKITVTFEALGREVSNIALTPQLLNQGRIPNINIIIKSSKYKLPTANVEIALGSDGAVTAGTKHPLTDGETIFEYEDATHLVAHLVSRIGTKTKPEAGSDKFTISTELVFDDPAAINAVLKGTQFKPKKGKLFDLGGVRASASLTLMK
jgi:hypothetical protein